MMKKILSILIASLCIFAFIIPVHADSDLYVIDEAGLLSQDDYAALQNKAQSLSEQYECGFYVVITDDMHGYSESDYAKGIYMNYDLGWSDGASGVLIAIAMNERYVDATAYGAARDTFTTSQLDYLLDEAYEYLLDGDYPGAFNRFLDASEEIIVADNYIYHEIEYTDPPIDQVTVSYSPEQLRNSWLSALPFGGLVAVLIGVIQGFIRKSQLKTTGKARNANLYVMNPRVNLTQRSDYYTGTTRSVQHVPRNNNRSGGGGHSYHSSGFSSSSGGRHF